jgi:hypothetical protein
VLKVNTKDRGTLLQIFPQVMSDRRAKPERSWQEIAADAAREPNPEKLLELSKELEDALDQRKKALFATNKPVKPDCEKKTG